jgi:hypothetical protein
MSILVNEDVQEVNQTDLVLGKLPEFSPEYQASQQQNFLLGVGATLAAGG